jgi:hypothetical protein
MVALDRKRRGVRRSGSPTGPRLPLPRWNGELVRWVGRGGDKLASPAPLDIPGRFAYATSTV